jgi:hypothetical protein
MHILCEECIHGAISEKDKDYYYCNKYKDLIGATENCKKFENKQSEFEKIALKQIKKLEDKMIRDKLKMFEDYREEAD